MKFDSELPRRLTPVIERRAGYAVARNIPRILADIERNIRDIGENSLTVTVKLRFEAVSHSCLNIKTSVGWVRKSSYVDNELGDLDIDSQQPELPFARLSVEVVEWDDTHETMRRIIAHAEANNLKLIRIANIGDPDCCQVQTYRDGRWGDHLLETPGEVEGVLQAVAEEGGMAYQERALLRQEDFEPELAIMPVLEG